METIFRVQAVYPQEEDPCWSTVVARPLITHMKVSANSFATTPAGCDLSDGDLITAEFDTSLDDDFYEAGLDLQTMEEELRELFSEYGFHRALIQISSKVCDACPVYAFCSVVKRPDSD